jgi:RNA polymerase sigma-70 factor (ECF subfamily)
VLREPHHEQDQEATRPVIVRVTGADFDAARDQSETPVLSDTQLVHAVCNGDAEALGQLYDRYSPTVNGLIRSILRDNRLAEEATHDVFLGIWQRPDAYDASRGPFAGWLFRVARNRAIDLFRRRREQPFALAPGSEQGDVIDPATFLVDPDPDPVDQAISTLQRESVREGLASLSADHRHLLELAYFQGMTQSEIAVHVNRPLGTVKTQIRSAMRKLAEVMNEMSTETHGSRVNHHREAASVESDPPLHLYDDHTGASNRV